MLGVSRTGETACRARAGVSSQVLSLRDPDLSPMLFTLMDRMWGRPLGGMWARFPLKGLQARVELPDPRIGVRRPSHDGSRKLGCHPAMLGKTREKLVD